MTQEEAATRYKELVQLFQTNHGDLDEESIFKMIQSLITSPDTKLHVKSLDPEASINIVASALQGNINNDAQRIANEGADWLSLLIRKNQDYGGSAWKKPVLAPDLESREAIFVRMSDKIERIAQLRSKDALVKDESLIDTIRDLGAYCLLWLTAPKKG